MAEPVIIERLFTARRGKTRTKVTLRIYKPLAEGRDVRCRAELRAGDRLLWPSRPEFRGMAGIDGLQAFVLATRLAACELLRFELDTGMRIDAWQWMDLIDFVGDAAISTHARDRLNEIEAAIRKMLHESREHEDRPQQAHAPASRKPLVAGRKPRAANRTRSR